MTTKFYLDGTRIIEQDNGTNPVHFLYDRNDEVIGFFYCGQTYLYAKNLQGDITAIINDEGFLIARYTYDDWGNCTVYSAEYDYNIIANLNPFRYRSYYYDVETGFYYLQSRYYDPEVGRFINCDDVNYIGVTESAISYNPFAYCENNPVNDSDPSGALTIEIGSALLYVALFFVAAAAVTGIVLNAYFTLYGFQNELSRDYNKLISPMFTMKAKIDLLNKVVRLYAKVAVSFIQKSISVAIAEVEIKQKVKKNGKDQYWIAYRNGNMVEIGKSISYQQAITTVSKGGNVFTTTKAKAKLDAQAAGRGKPPMHHGKHKNAPGYHPHYHMFNHSNSAHVWYLFES